MKNTLSMRLSIHEKINLKSHFRTSHKNKLRARAPYSEDSLKEIKDNNLTVFELKSEVYNPAQLLGYTKEEIFNFKF
jgi:hypothetical protein